MSEQNIGCALKYLQRALQKRFGAGRSDCGECTISISPDKIDMTDQECRIFARGPAHVAIVLRRKRRTK